ncbi:MAG: DNA recombination protein RmuC [Alphaproteobacteria bacterium]
MEQAIWLILGVALAGCAAGALFLLTRRNGGGGDAQIAEAITALGAAQQTLTSRMDEMRGALLQVSQNSTALSQRVDERLDVVTKRVGETLIDQGEKTTQSLGQLQERLAAIDAAQKNLTELSSQVVTLQDILANKQARGAFGQAQMEHIITDTLPAGTYAFNAPLSNGTRPDCTIRLPRSSTAIVVDAKFPRESFEALAGAQSAEAQRAAQVRVRAEVRKHIDDIAGKYLIPGETQDPAIMFVPAESIYCAVFADFFDIIQHAQRKRVVIVSPNMLMLAVNTMRALIRDQRMREQAHVIQEEVSKLLEDVRLLADRTTNLRKHFVQSDDDIRKIEISSEKILKRGERIKEVDIGEEEKVAVIEDAPLPLLAQGRG